MDSAVQLANAFLKSGTISKLQGQTYPEKTWTAESKNFVTEAPLMVLVTHGTAGPAEIVAAALKEITNARNLSAIAPLVPVPCRSRFLFPTAPCCFSLSPSITRPAGDAIQDKAVTPNIVAVAENSNGFGLQTPAAPHRSPGDNSDRTRRHQSSPDAARDAAARRSAE